MFKGEFWTRGLVREEAYSCTKVEITYPVSAWNWKGHQETLCAFHHHPIHTTEKERKKSINNELNIFTKENQEGVWSAVGGEAFESHAGEVVQDCGRHKDNLWVTLSTVSVSHSSSRSEAQRARPHLQHKDAQCHTAARTISGKSFFGQE